MDSARSVHLNSMFPKANAHLLATCAKPGRRMEASVWNALMAM